MSGGLGDDTYAVMEVREEQMLDALLSLSFDRRPRSSAHSLGVRLLTLHARIAIANIVVQSQLAVCQ